MDGATFVILKSLLNSAEGDVSDILALLGTTDISSIGDGTVTGAITTLKDLIGDISSTLDTINGEVV